MALSFKRFRRPRQCRHNFMLRRNIVTSASTFLAMRQPHEDSLKHPKDRQISVMIIS
jgi:hypothetical protein